MTKICHFKRPQTPLDSYRYARSPIYVVHSGLLWTNHDQRCQRKVGTSAAEKAQQIFLVKDATYPTQN